MRIMLIDYKRVGDEVNTIDTDDEVITIY